MTPEAYVIDIGFSDQCFIPFKSNRYDYWVLGEPFFRNFYTVFDDSKGIVGVAPSVNYFNAQITEGIVPNDPLYDMHKESKKQDQGNKELIPDLNDPIAVIKYMWRSLQDDITNFGKGDSKDNNLGLIAGIVLVGSLLCCTVCIMIYCCT